MLKTIRLAAVALVVSATATVHAQSSSTGEKPFVAATAEDILSAVETCEAAKNGEGFDTAQVRKNGWRRLSPPGGMPEGQTMFANRPSGASITIADGGKSACVIIGWVDDSNLAQSISTAISDKLELAMEAKSDSVSEAQKDGWIYTIALFTKPEVTSQIRMIVAIAPTNDGAQS